MGKIIYNGIDSESLGLVVQTPPSYSFPEKAIESFEIPGKNGVFMIDKNSYKNIDRVYLIGKEFKNDTMMYENATNIISWLTSNNGQYAILEDSYDHEYYRLASYNTSGEFSNLFDKGLSFTLTFNCKPQRFLKSGLIPIVYNYNSEDEKPTIEISNPTNFSSLPLITFKDVVVDLDETLMCTIRDYNNIVTSSITFTNLPDDTDVIFDSENQNVYDQDNNFLTYNVSLNGSTFPMLKKNKNKIDLTKYDINFVTVSSYNTIIIESQDICKAEYKPYEALVEANQKKQYVKSYSDIINLAKDSYLASSVKMMAEEQAVVYEFLSPNSLLEQKIGTAFQFTGRVKDNIWPSWLEATTENSSKFNLKAKVNGYFFITSTNEKRIKYFAVDEVIQTDLSTSGPSYTITKYDIIEDTTIIRDLYTDLPDCLTYEVQYGTDDDNRIFLEKIMFKTNKAGYYWKDKANIFDSASWTYTETGGVLLNELTWNTTKSAFIDNILSSTTKSFTYKYIEEVPEYEDIYQIVIKDDVQTMELASKVHFYVADTSVPQTLSAIHVYALDAGYYAFVINDGKSVEWKLSDPPIEVGGGIITAKLTGSDEFSIFYLDSIPDYSLEADWLVDIFNPVPVQNPDEEHKNEFMFEVKKTGLYRCSLESDITKFSEWSELSEGSYLVTNNNRNNAYFMCEIDEIPSVFPNDRAYTVDGDMSKDPPSWLKVTIDADADKDKQITYSANANGYFRWDTNESWQYKAADEILLTTGLKDDVIFYFLDSIPEYDGVMINDDEELLDLMDINPIFDAGGNPVNIKYVIKEPGYYKTNNGVDWIYYNENDLLLDTTIYETNRIYHLRESDVQDIDMEIIIVPNWWTL